MADDTDIQSAGISLWSAVDQAARVVHTPWRPLPRDAIQRHWVDYEAPAAFAAALRDMLTPATSVMERNQNEHA